MHDLPAHTHQQTNASVRIAALLTGLILIPTSQTTATELLAPNPGAGDQFGYSVSISGDTALAGARLDDDAGATSGSAYVFQDLDSDGSTATSDVKLTASDAASGDVFGHAVSISGSTALVSARADDSATKIDSGSAYIFRDLDTATGSITQNLKLTASDADNGDEFGFSASLSGSIALVGARFDDVDFVDSGSAYVFRDVNNINNIGTVTEDLKLTASDAVAGDKFGFSVSLSGDTALVGANGSSSGSAYVFRDLDMESGSVATPGSVTETIKLTASDAAATDGFGFSVSLSGNIALVGATGNDDNGSAYVFRDLDIVSGSVETPGSITETIKLTASDGASNDQFGVSVSQSGNTALVGARNDDDAGSNSGSAYLYKDLDTAPGSVATPGSVTENVKITASDAVAGDEFGFSVSISGDQFLIGSYRQNSNDGKAYSGTVSSVTTLDEGNTSRLISGLSFVSQDDWIIGKDTDFNQVTLGVGDKANVTASGKSVFIGENAGSNDNTLIIEGDLTATAVYVGSISGSYENTLQLNDAATFDVAVLYLAKYNTLSIEGDYTLEGDLFTFLDDTQLQVQNALGVYELLTVGNFGDLVSTTSAGGYTFVTAVPEPSSYALMMTVAALLYCGARRRRS